MNKETIVCNCKRGGKINIENVDLLKEELQKNNIKYIDVDDLCGTAVTEPEKLQNIFSNKDVTVIGCNERALKSLIDYAGIDDKSNISYHHIDKIPGDLFSTQENDTSSENAISYSEDWKPWYPVVDYERCSNCLQCLNFCLFGVYTTDDAGEVKVTQPNNCKDMCPACSRVCPEEAVIFPKHEGSPIDGGESDEKQEKSDLICDIQNNDVYAVLENRRRKQKISLLKKDQLKLAEEERKACSSKKDNRK